MPFKIMTLDDIQRILIIVIAYKNDTYAFQLALQKRSENFEYLYPEAKEKIPPPGSIEIFLSSWPDNLEKIDFNNAHLMINPSRDRYDDPRFRFLDELYIRGYPQPDYEHAKKQAIRWCQGILMSVLDGKDFDVNNFEEEIDFKGIIECYEVR